MAEDKSKKPEELNEEQLDEVSGGNSGKAGSTSGLGSAGRGR